MKCVLSRAYYNAAGFLSLSDVAIGSDLEISGPEDGLLLAGCGACVVRDECLGARACQIFKLWQREDLDARIVSVFQRRWLLAHGLSL